MPLGWPQAVAHRFTLRFIAAAAALGAA